MSEVCGQRYLQSEHNTFLRSFPGAWTVDVVGHAKECERWHVEDHGGKVAFKSVHSPGRFLRGWPNGEVGLASHCKAAELWEAHRNDDSSWSFYDVHGRWLSIQGDYKVCTMPHRRSSERFWLPWW